MNGPACISRSVSIFFACRKYYKNIAGDISDVKDAFIVFEPKQFLSPLTLILCLQANQYCNFATSFKVYVLLSVVETSFVDLFSGSGFPTTNHVFC